MGKPLLSFSAFCRTLGTPLHNVRWSWSARSSRHGRSVFTIWEHSLADGRYVFWDPAEDVRPRHGARTELVRIFGEAIAARDLALGILCQAEDANVEPRKRKSYDDQHLFILELAREDEELVGYVCGQTTAAAVVGGTHIFIERVAWAIDDLDPAPAGSDLPQRRPTGGSGFLRDAAVRSAVVRRAQGRCEYCGDTEFRKPDGTGYVETHHIIGLARQGPDTMANVIALCAGHHREAHYGANAETLEQEFLGILARLK